MSTPTPLTFTDEQLIEALKAAPEPVQGQVMVIAMQLELLERRASEEIEARDGD